MFEWLIDLFNSIFPAKIPSLRDMSKICEDGNKVLKLSAVQKISAGILAMIYHNESRSDSWIKLIANNGSISTIKQSKNETYGTPDIKNGEWIVPAESKKLENIVKINDKSGGVSSGYKAIAEYATRCVDGFIAYGNPVRIADSNGKVIYTFAQDKFDGIVSGMAKIGDQWILSIMDGSAPGVASTKGWVLRGQYPDVAVMSGKIYAFAKNGDVVILNEKTGKIEKKIGNTGSKAQRARVKDNKLIFWSTADYDQLWATNGKEMKKIQEWKDGDKPTGTTSGSLFNTSLTFDGEDIIFGRSVSNAGYKIYRVKLK